MPKRLPTRDNPGDSSGFEEHMIGSGDGDPIPIDLSFERVVCPRHGEPFRATWPTGFVTFSLNLFEALSKGVSPEEADSIQDMIDARPLCELVNAFDLLHAYQTSGIGVVGLCFICGTERAGTEYTTKTSASKLEVYPHMCFECVVFRLQPLN
jgi:hypothetical protein